ncbi:MAG: adenylate kinase family protein [Chlamydiales bacterium]
MNTLPILILLGPPGSGKGTQSKQLSKDLHYFHLSTGDLLRNESKKETTLGKKIRTFIDDGELVPDETIVNILLNSIHENNNLEGIILDGFPRTLAQAHLLYKKCGIKKIIVFHLDVDDDTIIKRIIQRRVCSQCGQLYHLEFRPSKKLGQCDLCNGKLEQRVDDNELTIKKRLEIYHKEIGPILEFYRNQGILIHIKGNDSNKKITDSILYKLK